MVRMADLGSHNILSAPVCLTHFACAKTGARLGNDLKAALPNRSIGTVDKFQGREAPIVIYSMTTSSPEDAPRGMEFLYSLNRLNVAVSRAQCLAVIVASPALFEISCRTPQQMRLANAFCRFLEIAG